MARKGYEPMNALNITPTSKLMGGFINVYGFPKFDTVILYNECVMARVCPSSKVLPRFVLGEEG